VAIQPCAVKTTPHLRLDPVDRGKQSRTQRAGVNSVLTPREKREEAWGRLAKDLDLAKLNAMTSRARLEDVPFLATEILDGKTRGRVVIDL
jgi:NADPH:quinone reductase-like Zn-dependent oxidoreductase